jgi:undecaprenyl-diphosphatase
MEHLNQTLFLWINATDPSAFSILLGRLLANGLVYVFPLYVVVSWLRSDAAGRDALVQAVLAASVALFLSWAMGKLWFHPRPFVVEIGHQYMPHEPNASFPSNHLSFIWALCAGLWMHPVRRRAAWVLGLLGLAVAWARIYMGVHWPLDMAGALVNAIVAAGLCLPLRPRVVPRLRALIEHPYRLICAWPIRKGWFRT